MSISERRAMWLERIQSFKESGEKNVAAWCRKHQINVNSMYSWLKKDALSQADEDQECTQWVPVQSFPLETDTNSKATGITLNLGQFSIEVETDFHPDTLYQVLQVVGQYVK